MKLLHFVAVFVISGAALAASPRVLPASGPYRWVTQGSGGVGIAHCITVVSDAAARTIALDSEVCRITLRRVETSNPSETGRFVCLNPAGAPEGLFGRFTSRSITVDGKIVYTQDAGVTKSAQEIHFRNDERITAKLDESGSPCTLP